MNGFLKIEIQGSATRRMPARQFKPTGLHRRTGGYFLMDSQREIIERLDRLESLVRTALGVRHVEPDILTWRAIAGRLGIIGKAPDQAARRRITRARDAGAAMRVTRNGVNAKDFSRWLVGLEAEHPSRADQVRAALKGASR